MQYGNRRLHAWVLAGVASALALTGFFLLDRHGAPLHTNPRWWFAVVCFALIPTVSFRRPAAVVTSSKIRFYGAWPKRPVEVILTKLASFSEGHLELLLRLDDGSAIHLFTTRFREDELKRFCSDLASYLETGRWPTCERAA